MDLFKSLLMSLYPRSFTGGEYQVPAVISLVSSHRFFHTVIKKISDYYKINYFDVDIDPFDLKIGFGDQPMIAAKDLENYIGYNCAANLCGYRFYNISNISIAISILVGSRWSQHSIESKLFVMLIYTVNITMYIFFAKIKILPYEDDAQNYNWFVKVFWNLYETILYDSGYKNYKRKFNQIKKTLSQDAEVMFLLFRISKILNYFENINDITNVEDYYMWLLGDHLDPKKDKIRQNFINNYKHTIFSDHFDNTEVDAISIIGPSDLLIKFLIGHPDGVDLISQIGSAIYADIDIDRYIKYALYTDEYIAELLDILLDYDIYKKSFFQGVFKFTTYKFRLSSKTDISTLLEEITQGGDIDEEKISKSIVGGNIKIPDEIYQEALFMDHMVNFYTNFVGGLSTARGDNFNTRIFHRDIIHQIIGDNFQTNISSQSIQYYGNQLHLYSKNIFYYQNMFEGSRSKANNFTLPYMSTHQQIYNNIYILKMMDENAICNILQDINLSDHEIYISNTHIHKLFKQQKGEEISQIVKLEKDQLISHIYNPIQNLLNYDIISIFQKKLQLKDISILKNKLYYIDIWIWRDILIQIHQKLGEELGSKYSDLVIIHIIGNLREHILGIMIIYHSFITKQAKTPDQDLLILDLMQIIVVDIIGIEAIHSMTILQILSSIYAIYTDYISAFEHMDENPFYIGVFRLSRDMYISRKYSGNPYHIIGEDILWLKGFLKNMSYYNRRMLIPSR